MVSSVFVVVVVAVVAVASIFVLVLSTYFLSHSVIPTAIEAVRFKPMAQRKISSAVRQQMAGQLHVAPVHADSI